MHRLFMPLLFVSTMAWAQTAPAPPVAYAPATTTGRGQLFQIVLVRGAMTGPEEIVGIPKNAEKAIRDIRDFLPFKSYKVLDSGLIRTEENSMAKVRLDGLPPQQYDVNITWRTSSKQSLSVWDFSVNPVPQPGSTPLPKGVAPAAVRPVISTSFSIDVGETVVVGSSKLGGDQALVVLVTAVPATK